MADGGRNCVVLCDAKLPPVKMGKLFLLLLFLKSRCEVLWRKQPVSCHGLLKADDDGSLVYDLAI